MARIVCCGEAMLELSRHGGDSMGWRMGYGGDTLNMAIHLARSGHYVACLTALGSDPFSAELAAAFASEGLDTRLVLTHPVRGAGLYAITTDDHGERTFTYWREASAAREMFALPAMAAASEQAANARLLVFSLISLAILPDAGRIALLGLAARVRRNGGQVAFDGNFRPRLWDAPDLARAWRDRAIRSADFGFPTLEDETMLSGETSADAVAAHWQGLGCTETMVKLGSAGCRLPDGTILPPTETLRPVDTSGAGDAFNAGYLDARLQGAEPAEAACQGHALAGWTIMRPGAVPARDS